MHLLECWAFCNATRMSKAFLPASRSELKLFGPALLLDKRHFVIRVTGCPHPGGLSKNLRCVLPWLRGVFLSLGGARPHGAASLRAVVSTTRARLAFSVGRPVFGATSAVAPIRMPPNASSPTYAPNATDSPFQLVCRCSAPVRPVRDDQSPGPVAAVTVNVGVPDARSAALVFNVGVPDARSEALVFFFLTICTHKAAHI